MPKSKKKNTTKSRKPMDPIEEETTSLNQESRLQIDNTSLTNSSTSAEIFGNNSHNLFTFYNMPSTTYAFSSTNISQRHNQSAYHINKHGFASRVDEETSPLNLLNPPHSHEVLKVKTWKFDENSSVTKLLLDCTRFATIENMFRPYIEKGGETKTEIPSPLEGKEKRKVNRLDSEIHFLNSADQDDIRFINVTKNKLALYDLICDYKNEEPQMEFVVSKQIPSVQDENEYACRCVAVDSSKENRIALGLNSGDIFVTSIPANKEFNFSTSYHIKMHQNFDSIVGLAFDKTLLGQSYLSCGYERGRESEHFLSLYDVNQGKDLILDRDVSEKILGMQFLSSDLAVLLLNCMKSVRFVDIRERSGFAAILNLSTPLYKVAVEPYNNVQFAGVISNSMTIFDRRYLSKPLYEFQIGPKSYNISHLEWNPNRYANITCCSFTSNTIFELDILPTPKYAHHLIGNKSSEPQEAIVTEYANRFSYGLEKIITPLSTVQHFAWCHQKANIIVGTPPCLTTDSRYPEWTKVKVFTVENDRCVVSIPPDNSIFYCDETGFNQVQIKPQIEHKKQSCQYTKVYDGNNLTVAVNDLFENPDSEQEKVDLAKKIKLVKAKPTFELEPEEIDLLFEMEQRELKLMNEKIDYDHFETHTENVQRHIPFSADKFQARPLVNKTLQRWFTRSDINRQSIARAKLGYGFASVPGSAKDLIKNSYYAIKDRSEETQCLKDCWKMLIRIYSSNQTAKLMVRFGTVFPGVRRMSHSLNSKPTFREDKITFRNKYYVSERRDDILRLVGWVPLDDYQHLGTKLERLANSSDIRSKTRAAGMAMFYLQGYASKTYLDKILAYLDTSECFNRYSPTIIGHYKSMVIKMLDVIETNDGISIKGFDKLLEEIEDPYLNVMLQFLGRRQFTYNFMQRQIMATDEIRLNDRIAIAAIHMDDESIRYSMKVLTKSLQKSHNPLSVLLISGLDDHRYSHLALHAYLKQTNDIQTTALILCAGNCFNKSKIWDETYDMRQPVMERVLLAIASNTLKNTRKYSLQVVCSYMEWLQANNLTLQKSYIMTFLRKKIEFPRNESAIQASRTQSMVACNFCGKPILPFIGNDSSDNVQTLKMPPNANRKVLSVAQSLQIVEIERRKLLPKSRGCPHCGRPLPRCLICKRTCIQQKEASYKCAQMDDWFIFCTKCAHGGHLSHLRSWFSINELCPAGGCNCSCPKIDNIFNADYQAKRKEQEMFDDPFLINGFNVKVLSATVESNTRSRNNSEQDKMRLIRKLCMSSSNLNSAFDNFYRRSSNDSGITLNMADPLQCIYSLKTSAQRNFTGSNVNLAVEHRSAMSSRSTDLLCGAEQKWSLDKKPLSKQLEEFGSMNMKEDETMNEHGQQLEHTKDDNERNIAESTQSWNMTPELVKQSNVMGKFLEIQGLRQATDESQSGSRLDLAGKDAGTSRLLSGADDFGISRLSKTQHRQHVRLMPKKTNKLNQISQNIGGVEPISKPHGTLVCANSDPQDDQWIVSNRDRIGRPIASQIKVTYDKMENNDNEPTSLQSLEKNVCFKEHNILLPAREHPLTTAWLSNSQTLHRLAILEMFKTSVAEEKINNGLENKKVAAQLFREQMNKEQTRKKSREKRKQMRNKSNVDRNLKKLRVGLQRGSSYFSFDCGLVEVETISSESENENPEDAEEVAKLCARLEQNIQVEQQEIRRLQEHGFQDLNSLANALKEAEEKKKRVTKKNKRVRIKTTPEVRIATPAFDYNDSSNFTASELSPRQRKNSTRGGGVSLQQVESVKVIEGKLSDERRLSGERSNLDEHKTPSEHTNSGQRKFRKSKS